MTIAVIWQEDGYQWCAADTRLVTGADDRATTELASKIYSIPLATSAMLPDSLVRVPHYWTQFGFVFAGSVQPATATAITAATFLQKLARPGERASPPTFEEIAELVRRLAERFVRERRQLGSDALFSAGFFGWCPHSSKFKVAYINALEDAVGFRVEISYPVAPKTDGEPWLVLGSASGTFLSTLAQYQDLKGKRVPRRVIERMVREGADPTVGGATSIGMAHEHGFELFFALDPIGSGSQVRPVFNGLDLQLEVGQVGQYIVAINGLA